MSRISRVYYGWWIVLTGGILMALMAGPYFHGVGTFIDAFDEEFGWDRALIAGAFSLSRLEGSVLGPISGYLTDRLKPAKMVLIGFIIMGLGYFVMSRISNPIILYAAFITIAIGGGIGGFIPAMSVTNNWFTRRRATAMAFVMAGSSIGGLLVPLLAWGISNHGWRMTAIGIGFVMILVSLPFALIYRRAPGENEDAPAPRPSQTETASRQEVDTAPEGFTGKEAMRTKAFWYLALAHTAGNMSIVVVAVHGIPHMTDIGIGLELAGTVVAVYTFMSLAFQLVGGFIGDKVNKQAAIWAFISLQGISMLVFAFTTNIGMAFAFAVLFGIGFGGRGPILNAIRAEFFGRKAFATILGLSSMPMNIGMVISPLVLGYLFDAYGTYRYGMIGLAFIAIAGSTLALLAARPQLKTRQALPSEASASRG